MFPTAKTIERRNRQRERRDIEHEMRERRREERIHRSRQIRVSMIDKITNKIDEIENSENNEQKFRDILGWYKYLNKIVSGTWIHAICPVEYFPLFEKMHAKIPLFRNQLENSDNISLELKTNCYNELTEIETIFNVYTENNIIDMYQNAINQNLQ